MKGLGIVERMERDDARWRRGRVSGGHSLAPLAVAALFAALPAAGQVAQPGVVQPRTTAVENPVAPVPFGPGERLEYQVKLGIASVGEGVMQVHRVEPVRGQNSYHVQMTIRGGIPLARVNDNYQSWLDVGELFTHRFIQDVHQVRYKRFRQFELFPEELRWERADVEEEGELASHEPLDDISFVYYVRTLPLEVGDVYTLSRYFRETGNPVVVRVLRKERITVPAGTFNTIVVQPLIRTSGLFGEGGEAELHFSDDERRLLVYMRSRVPVMGSLTLHLRAIQEGTPIRRLNLADLVAPPGTTRMPPAGGR